MANDYIANPIYLDTFTSAIDVGDSVFGNTNAQMRIAKIKWVNAAATNTALISDADGNVIFKDTAETDNVARESAAEDFWVKGLKIAVSGIGGGQVLIYLR